MRAVFFDRFKQLIREDERLFFLTGDTGYNLIEPLFEELPERTLNVGIAEQNLIGIAAGLCNTGFIPVCYAITNFLTIRCLEQIRNDICLHNYKVLLVATSTGFDNGGLGPTHHKLDDIGCVKSFPNMNIYSPSGRKSMEIIVDEALQSSCASFIRITKGDFSENNSITDPNHFVYKQDNAGVLIISHGKMISHCVKAVSADMGVSVFAMDRIKPLDEKRLQQLFNSHKKVIVVEDNFKSGLYNSICQWIVEKRIGNYALYSIHPPEKYEREIGDSSYLEDKYGLSPEKIRKFVSDLI